MEIIGRLIATIVLVFAACMAGGICAVAVELAFRRTKRPARKVYIVAALFPPTAMLFWIVCVLVSTALSGVAGTPDLIFGDIHERLPNGYWLNALSKMPESGLIQQAEPTFEIAWVGSIQVNGPYVLGKYDYTDFPRTQQEASRNFFVLDTRTGRTTNFATEAQLEDAAKVKISLTPNGSFRGPKTRQERVAWRAFLIVMAVPLVVGFWLLLQFVKLIRNPRYRAMHPA